MGKSCFRKSLVDGQLVLIHCNICHDDDIVDCREAKCPHTFPKENTDVTDSIFSALRKALEKKNG